MIAAKGAYAHTRSLLIRLPGTWKVEKRLEDPNGVFGVVAVNHVRGVAVIYSHAEFSDGHEWLHVSVSKRDQTIPSWEEMMRVKNLFIGEDIEAYQVAPPKDRYVNINDGVLHWWACLGEPRGVLPQFEAEGERVLGMKSI